MIAILGMILIVALPLNYPGGRLTGYYLTQASPTPFVALLSLIASNIAGNLLPGKLWALPLHQLI